MGYRAYIPNFKVIGRYFEIGGFGGGGERGGISENGHNSSSSNVPENTHIKFQENRTKFREFLGEVPPWGANLGDFGKTEKGIR